MALVCKKDLVRKVALEANATQGVTADVINAFSRVVKDVLANDDEMIVVGLGKWSTKIRDATTYKMPDGRIIESPAYKYPSFTFGEPIKREVKKIKIK